MWKFEDETQFDDEAMMRMPQADCHVDSSFSLLGRTQILLTTFVAMTVQY